MQPPCVITAVPAATLFCRLLNDAGSKKQFVLGSSLRTSPDAPDFPGSPTPRATPTTSGGDGQDDGDGDAGGGKRRRLDAVNANAAAVGGQVERAETVGVATAASAQLPLPAAAAAQAPAHAAAPAGGVVAMLLDDLGRKPSAEDDALGQEPSKTGPSGKQANLSRPTSVITDCA